MSYTTIKDVKRRIRELGAFPAENQSELMELCGAHPKSVGASGVVRNWDSRDFGLMFTYDGAPPLTFSMETAALYYLGKPLPDSRRSALLNALRMEINDQICAFRNASGFRGRSDFHVDHEIKFRDLAAEWIATGKSCETEWVYDEFFKHMQPFLRDRSAAADWKKFHANRAKLRMLTAEENRRLRLVRFI